MATPEQRTAQAVLEGLRSPLNGVAGLLDLLATTRLSAQQRQYLQVMQATVTQLGVAVEDGVELSVLDPALRIQSFSPAAILRSVRDAFLAPAHSRGVQLSLESSEAVPERLRGDAVAWRQLAFATLERAFARSKSGIYGHMTYSDGHLRLRVATNGPEADFSPLVLDPPALIATIGGTWDVFTLSDGITIDVALPATIDDDATPASGNVVMIRSTIARHRIASPPSRILVVEDIRSTRMMIRSILERSGHTVVDCETADQALNILTHSAFDCAIVDLHLPDMHGARFVKEWRFMEQGRRTPAIGISADTSDEAMREVEAAGLLGLIPKPPSPERLLAALSFALSLGRSSDDDETDPSEPEPIIDTASFAETRALLGQPAMRTLVAQSIKDGRRCISTISNGALAHDLNQWSEAMQALRGVALTIGASKLAAAVAASIDRQDMFGPGAQPQLFERLLAEAESALGREAT